MVHTPEVAQNDSKADKKYTIDAVQIEEIVAQESISVWIADNKAETKVREIPNARLITISDVSERLKVMEAQGLISGSNVKPTGEKRQTCSL